MVKARYARGPTVRARSRGGVVIFQLVFKNKSRVFGLLTWQFAML